MTPLRGVPFNKFTKSSPVLTFQEYLVNVFKGPGEKSFLKGSFQEFFIDCILIFFSTFQEYLVNVFKGPGEKLFKGFSPRTFCEPCILIFSTFQ